MISPVYGPLIEKLLAGEFICAITDEVQFTKLQDEQTRDSIDAYLKPLNRRLAANDEGKVLSAYRDLMRVDAAFSATIESDGLCRH